MTKRVCFWVIAFVVVIFASSCRHSTDGDDNKPVPAPAPVVKKLDKIVVAGDGVTEIAVEKGTDITTNPISTKGIKINALYNTGEILVTRENDFTTDGWSVDFSQINTADETDKTNNRGYTQPIVFTYTYEGVTATAEVLVRIVDSNNFESIEVVDSSRVKDHDIGETFDPFGLVVRVVLDSAANDYVDVIDFSDDTKWTFESTSGTGTVDTSAANDALQVTVTYTTSSKSDSKDFTIVVYDGDDVNSIEITQFPNKTEYDYGSTDLDLTGLNVKLILKKDNREVLVNDWTGVNQSGSKWTYAGFDGNQDATPQEITLTYTTRGGNTYDVKFTVTVSDKITGIKLVSPPNDLEYIIGETFDPTGLEIKVLHLNSGNDFTRSFTDASQFTGNWELAGWNAGNEAEALALTVRYKNDAGSVIYGECSFNVTIFSISNISITQPTDYDVIYFDGESVENVKNIYLATAGVNLNLKAGSITRDENYPVTSPIFSSVNLSVVGDVNATGDKFEYKTGNATVTCTISWGSQTRDPSFGLTVKKTYQFHSGIVGLTPSEVQALPSSVAVLGDHISYSAQNIPSNTVTTTISELKFVKFGDYPQSVAPDSLHVYEIDARKTTIGGMDMYLGADGDYYVKVKAEKNGQAGVYKLSDGSTLVDKKEYWFKVEPIVWRVLSTSYNGNALLWSVKAIERMPYFADSYSPDDAQVAGELIGGGKSEREIAGVAVQWSDYKYSTLRAFLRGEYEPEDPQASASYKQIFTGKGDSEVLLEKFDSNGKKKGLFQRIFDDNAQTLIKPVYLSDVDVTDKLFVLSKVELQTSDPDYYFKDESVVTIGKKGDSQNQRMKMPTDYTLARGSKVWSTNNNGSIVDYPGSDIWTRTETDTSSVNVIGGHGAINSAGRGAWKNASVVPAICVDPTELPAF